MKCKHCGEQMQQHFGPLWYCKNDDKHAVANTAKTTNDSCIDTDIKVGQMVEAIKGGYSGLMSIGDILEFNGTQSGLIEEAYVLTGIQIKNYTNPGGFRVIIRKSLFTEFFKPISIDRPGWAVANTTFYLTRAGAQFMNKQYPARPGRLHWQGRDRGEILDFRTSMSGKGFCRFMMFDSNGKRHAGSYRILEEDINKYMDDIPF